MKPFYEILIEAAKELNHDQLVRFLINEKRDDVDKLFDLAAAKYTEQSKSHIPVVMQGLPTENEIERWVKEHGYYGSCTQEYHEGLEEGARWVMSKLSGSPTVGKAGEDASVSDGK